MLFFLAICTFLGCAKVSLQTAQPLKVDINMRVDVYQHVVQEVESIEDQIYGSPEKKTNSFSFIREVYADDGGSVAGAIERRKQRVGQIEEYFQQGYIGENKDAYLQVLPSNVPQEKLSGIGELIQAENQDREILYQETARKTNATLSQVQKASFADRYRRAGSGFWFEIYDEQMDKYVWSKK